MRWALFAFALLLSCGTKPPPCDRTSCSIGCCDARGLCVSGLSDSACGERGAACEACPSSSVCQAGRCGALSGAGGGSAFFDAGSPDAGVQLGSACAQLGFFCFNPSTALECVSRTWRGLPCRGPGGCTTDGGTTSCDMNGNLEADACASSSEGKGLCTADGGGTLECRSGLLVKTNICRTCTVSGDVVICQP